MSEMTRTPMRVLRMMAMLADNHAACQIEARDSSGGVGSDGRPRQPLKVSKCGSMAI
jgi:hypothetical protein